MHEKLAHISLYSQNKLWQPVNVDARHQPVSPDPRRPCLTPEYRPSMQALRPTSSFMLLLTAPLHTTSPADPTLHTTTDSASRRGTRTGGQLGTRVIRDCTHHNRRVQCRSSGWSCLPILLGWALDEDTGMYFMLEILRPEVFCAQNTSH